MPEHTIHRRRVRNAVLTATAAILALTLAVAPSGVASADNSDPPRLPSPGFLLDRGGRVTTLEVPDAVRQTAVGGVNDHGQIVGKYPTADNVFHGFLRSKSGRYSRIDFPGAMGTYASKINNRGQIVGMYNLTNPRVGAPGTMGYLLERGRFTTINVPGSVYTQAFGINDKGVVVGEFLDSGGTFHGYRWERGRFTTIDVPGSIGTTLTDINNRGDVLGIYSEDFTKGIHGFVRSSRGVDTSFDAPDAPYTLAWGINDRRQVVGSGFLDLNLTGVQGFLGSPSRTSGYRFSPVDVPGALMTGPSDVNNSRQIVGSYDNPAAAQANSGSMQPMGMGMGG
jgi:probable HAF family extracellular repeat protein